MHDPKVAMLPKVGTVNDLYTAGRHRAILAAAIWTPSLRPPNQGEVFRYVGSLTVPAEDGLPSQPPAT